jgi:AcrR family transcriptional regulator
MVRQRFDKLDPQRQEQLLQAAADEFAEQGFERASLNRIITRAGTSKGSLYYYFEDKTDLFATVIERATAQVVQFVAGFSLDDLTAETYWPAMESFMRRSAAYLSGNAWYLRLARSFYRLRARSGSAGPMARVFDWARIWVTRSVARGQELGVVRGDLPLPFLAELALAVGEVGDVWLLERWEELSEADRERLIVAELGLFRRLLEPGAAVAG